MIRTHAEKIFDALNQLRGSDGSRDPKLVSQLLQTAFDESKNLMDALNKDPDYENKYEELLVNHENQSAILDEVLNENKSLKAEIDVLTGTVNNYEEAVTEARTIRADLEAQNEALVKEKEELVKKCAETEGRLNMANENNSPMQKEIFRSLQKIETEMSKLTAKVGNTNKEISNNSKKVESLNKSVEGLIKTNEDVAEVTKVYSDTLEDLRGDINDVHEDFEALENEQESLKESFEEVERDVEEINEVADNAKEIAEEAKTEVDKCNGFFGKLKNIFGE